MPGTIDESVLSAVRRILEGARDDNWETVNLEVQDGGRFLLISVQVAEPISPQAYSRYHGSLMTSLSAVVPPRKDDYPWMVVFSHGRTVIESIHPRAF